MSEVLQKAQQLCATTTKAKALANVWVGTAERAVFGQRSVAGYCIAARNVLRHPPRPPLPQAWAHTPSGHGGDHTTALSRGGTCAERQPPVQLAQTSLQTGSHGAEDGRRLWREAKVDF